MNEIIEIQGHRKAEELKVIVYADHVMAWGKIEEDLERELAKWALRLKHSG